MITRNSGSFLDFVWLGRVEYGALFCILLNFVILGF